MTTPIDTQQFADLLHQHGALRMPSEQQLDEHKARAYGQLDSPTRGRSVYIDSNQLIDLVGCAKSLRTVYVEIERKDAEIARLRAFVVEFIDAWEAGMGGDSSLIDAARALASQQGEQT